MNRAVTAARDMTWILDHSIEMGGEKLLAAIGISNRTMAEKDTFVPNFDDAMLFDLEVSTQSTGKSVQRKLEEMTERYGSPRKKRQIF